MTTKPKTQPLNGMHTAGIFSDMSVDGPEIGTLVVVVDRAKNLPNRKTIGKQDPYCAARLGKEAKKTTTDIRGGQTPKWDQELRFTVHDSPDYYQLKVSVFNDDKKTELIGEAWIDLRGIVVPGGGQSDQWHQLGCRGKYAGELRIEITYYDSRPKPEKPAVKTKPPVADEPEATPAASGPRTMPKRRPLPSDPITGKSPAASSPAPEQIETPPRPQPHPASIPHQPPLQHVDYHPEAGTPSRRAEAPAQPYRTPDRFDQYPTQQNDLGYAPHHHQPPIYDRHDPQDFDDDRPPPPPAHRSRTGSNPSVSAGFQGTPPTMRQDVLRSEAHRHSETATYPGRPTYKASDSAPAGLSISQYHNADQASRVRHHSYDASYDMPQRTMQATVEDVPESPDSMNNSLRRGSGRWPQPQPPHQAPFDPDYDMTASPAPLSLSARGSSELARYPPPLPSDPSRHRGPDGYPMPPPDSQQQESAEHAPDYGRYSEPLLGLHSSHEEQKALTYRGELDDGSGGYAVPPVPPSLVPGIDPNLAQEISERISHERSLSNQTRRYPQQQVTETPPRGRTMEHHYGRDGPAAAYGSAPPAHSRSPVTYSNGPSTSSVNVVIRSRAYSPNPPRDPSPNPHPQHTIRRKSVSPRPPAENSRRLSGVPFGPDSYDALNPSASAAAIKDTAASRPDYHEATGKIITHDGREVDPSDHLPVESWAPEPEPKAASSISPSARPSPSGPQPLPPSGRRPLRIAGRPQSMLPQSSAVTYSGSDHVEPAAASPSVATGRNRLQKKAAYRQSTSAIAPVMSGANGPGPGATSNDDFRRRSSGNSMEPTPLAPIPPHQDNFTPPRHLPRAATFDYAAGPSNENYAPPHSHSHHGGGSPGHTNNRGAPPPIPAKVPLALPPPGGSTGSGAPGGAMSGALQLHSSSVARRAGNGIDDGYHHHHYHPHHQHQHQHEPHHVYGSGQALSLEEELRQIDIGTGRSSRRHAAQTHAGQAYGSVYGQGGY